MTPSPHILTLEGSDGTVIFVCNFCGAQAGPIPSSVPITAVELYHTPECFYTEARRLTAKLVIDQVSQ